MAKPFLKWAGGKGKLLPQLRPLLPPDGARRRYVEPFVGGGAMFFDLEPRAAILADINMALVRTYLAVRDDVEAVIRHLRSLAERYRPDDVDTYYDVRTRYNTQALTSYERAALFIYLNKTCFNGLHRVNKKGEFNTPAGRYKNPRILDADGLRAVSMALAGTDIWSVGFEELPTYARPKDFIYLDPPYAPVSETANFTSYASGGFTAADQRKLRDIFCELDHRGCKLMLSNSDVPAIRDLYAAYDITEVQAARAINSKAAGRGPVTELVIRNYR